MITWQKSSDYSIKSSCGRFHIAKSLLGGTENFMLWDGTVIIGHWPEAQEAKKAAERLKNAK